MEHLSSRGRIFIHVLCKQHRTSSGASWATRLLLLGRSLLLTPPVAHWLYLIRCHPVTSVLTSLMPAVVTTVRTSSPFPNPPNINNQTSNTMEQHIPPPHNRPSQRSAQRQPDLYNLRRLNIPLPLRFRVPNNRHSLSLVQHLHQRRIAPIRIRPRPTLLLRHRRRRRFAFKNDASVP